MEYHIEYALKQDPADGHSYYQPIGAWAHGLWGGLNVYGLYLPEETEARERADWVLNDLVEQEVVTLPDDWQRRKAASIGLYQGDASPIYVTEGHKHMMWRNAYWR